MIDIKKIESIKWDDLGLDVQILEYVNMYETLRMEHPVYSKGWHSSYYSEHRFLNHVVKAMFSKGILNNRDIVVDIAAYDGMLVRDLRDMKICAFGQEAIEWPKMWKLIGVESLINVDNVNADIVIALNYAHAWQPEDFPAIAGCPQLLIADRERRTPHYNAKTWYDINRLQKAGWIVVEMKNCKKSIETERDLLIWQNTKLG